MTRSGVVSSLSSVLPTSHMFTSGYVNTETILYFFYKITNERGTKTVFTYAHVKWFYGQSEHAYYLNYFIIMLLHALVRTSWRLDHFYQCSVSLSYKNNSLINCSVAFKQLLQLAYFILGSYFFKQLEVVMKCSPFLLNLRWICIYYW